MNINNNVAITNNFEESSNNAEQLKSGVRGLLRHFLRESSIHGVKYVGMRDLHIFERVFWICGVAAACGFSAFLVAQVIQKYDDNPVIIGFQPLETKISQIPFPAITICNVNVLKRSLLAETRLEINEKYHTVMLENGNLVDNIRDSAERENDIREAFFMSEYIAQFCFSAQSLRRLLNDSLVDSHGDPDTLVFVPSVVQQLVDQGLIPESITENDIPPEMYQKIAQLGVRGITNCSDLIIKCMWALDFIPCEELFRFVRTEYGWCCQFNMMPSTILRNVHLDNYTGSVSEEKQKAWEQFNVEDLILSKEKAEKVKDPFHQKSGGKQYGLSLLLNPDANEYSTCTTSDGWGFKMVAHSPISYPRFADYGVAIPINNEVFVDLDPLVTTADKKALKDIDVKKRGCYFRGDDGANLVNYKFYSAANCIDECLAKYTFDNCSCVQYYMPRANVSQVICKTSQRKCTENVRVNLLVKGTGGGQCSHCLPPCTDIKYKTHVSYFPLREGGNNGAFLYTDASGEKSAFNYSIVHIFFGTDSFNVKERKRLYDFWDLLANTGGLLGFALGFSIISVVEIVYFLTIRAWFYFREGKSGQSSMNNNHCWWAASSSSQKFPPSVMFVKPRQQKLIHEFYSSYYNQPYNNNFGHYR